ncbi:MAG: hypothetical protein AAF763_08935 [Pseudomonadota bacterium]
MLDALRRVSDRILGRGEASIVVPTLDGVLKPNAALDGAEPVFDARSPRDLASDGAHLYLADGTHLLRLDGAEARPVQDFGRRLTAIAALPDGRFAVALDGTEVRLLDRPDATTPARTWTGGGMTAVNALAPDGAGGLVATDGSSRHGADDWVRDLMEQRRGGRILRLREDGEAEVAADQLGHAFGAAARGDDLLVSESWRHRLLRLSRDGRRQVALPRLPVYPSRLSPAAGGGWWLTAFAARSRLVEFVLREPAFLKRMIAELDPDHWIAPRLRSGESVMEPMQGAHLKTMGVTKPWAPPRAYGMVIRLDAAAQPVGSLQSRADGRIHGVVSAAEHAGHLHLLARGPRQVLRLPLAGLATGDAR